MKYARIETRGEVTWASLQGNSFRVLDGTPYDGGDRKDRRSLPTTCDCWRR